MKKHSFTQKLTDFLNGKGFYIALVLCFAAIGASGWYIWQSFTTASKLAAETSNVQTVTMDPADVEETILSGTEETEEDTSSAETSTAAEEDTSNQTETDAENAETETIALEEPEAEETVEPVADIPEEPAAETIEAVEAEWQWPLDGNVVAAFSSDTLTYNSALNDWRTHNGIDLSAEVGSEVCSVHAGTVLSVENDPILGQTVKIDCGDGLTAVYGNLSETVSVAPGDKVSAGTVIGSVGETAAGEANDQAWLHFSLMKGGEAIDPAEFLE